LSVCSSSAGKPASESQALRLLPSTSELVSESQPLPFPSPSPANRRHGGHRGEVPAPQVEKRPEPSVRFLNPSPGKPGLPLVRPPKCPSSRVMTLTALPKDRNDHHRRTETRATRRIQRIGTDTLPGSHRLLAASCDQCRAFPATLRRFTRSCRNNSSLHRAPNAAHHRSGGPSRHPVIGVGSPGY